MLRIGIGALIGTVVGAGILYTYDKVTMTNHLKKYHDLHNRITTIILENFGDKFENTIDMAQFECPISKPKFAGV